MKGKKIIASPGKIDCPHCARQNDAISGNGTPKTGDWTICYGCHKISRFIVPADRFISLRKATASELVAFARDVPDLAQKLAVVDPEIAAAVAECKRRYPQCTADEPPCAECRDGHA